MRVQEIPNIKFQVTPAESQAIQEALFIRGGYWGQSGPVTQNPHQPFPKLRQGALSLVNLGEGGYGKWKALKHREVTFNEAMHLITQCEVPTEPDIVEVPMSEVYVIVADAYDVETDQLKFIEG